MHIASLEILMEYSPFKCNCSYHVSCDCIERAKGAIPSPLESFCIPHCPNIFTLLSLLLIPPIPIDWFLPQKPLELYKCLLLLLYKKNCGVRGGERRGHLPDRRDIAGSPRYLPYPVTLRKWKWLYGYLDRTYTNCPNTFAVYYMIQVASDVKMAAELADERESMFVNLVGNSQLHCTI